MGKQSRKGFQAGKGPYRDSAKQRHHRLVRRGAKRLFELVEAQRPVPLFALRRPRGQQSGHARFRGCMGF